MHQVGDQYTRIVNPRTVQPAVSSNKDWVIPAHRTQTHTAGKLGFGTAPLSFLLFCVIYPNWQLQAVRPPIGPTQPRVQNVPGGCTFIFPRKQNGRSLKMTTQLHLLPTTPLSSTGRALHHYLRHHGQLFKLLYQSHTLSAGFTLV